MTKEELIPAIQTNGYVIVSADDFHTMFPGRVLTAIEHEFRKEVTLAGGPRFLEHGTSQPDLLLTFCQKHNLSFRWVKDRVLFWRGPFIQPHIVKVMELGEL